MSSTVPSPNDKSLGAYYTEENVARFLAEWSIRTGTDTVLEPSFGGGAFITAAASRLQTLGALPHRQLYGCELSNAAYDAFRDTGAAAMALDPAKLFNADFFDLSPEQFKVSAVLGNPPFIRYHLFAGESRAKGLTCARQAGVPLSELSSSWAPFIVHAVRFLQPGGRLGMVAPLELLHALYAGPVLKHLADTFAQVSLLTFDRRLFPDLSQDTVLVLADGYGEGPGRAQIVRLADGGALANYGSIKPVDIDVKGLHGGTTRAAIYRLPPAARDLYERLTTDPRVRRLGDFADVGIGYVTGANDFFHVSTTAARELGLRQADLLPAIRRGRDLKRTGLALTKADWDALLSADGAHWLFYPTDPLDHAASHHIQNGEAQQIHTGYKCRTRRPWYKVPWVAVPDLILTVMSGEGPRLVANQAQVVATNTLHVVRLKQQILPQLVAATAWTTLTALSAEIEGHALGGGLLKLEPSEAGRLGLPLPADPSSVPPNWEAIDEHLRRGDLSGATDLADQIFLAQYLGLSRGEVDLLRQALHDLRTWRKER